MTSSVQTTVVQIKAGRFARTLCKDRMIYSLIIAGGVVVLPDSFRGIGAWRNFTEIQQSGHAPKSGPEVKNERNSAKDGAPERLRCGTIQEEVT